VSYCVDGLDLPSFPE
jgi:hypothetical protein